MSVIVMSFVIGVVLMIFGLLIWKKGKIELIHAYHYKNVQDKEGYTKAMGKTISAMGLLIVFSGGLALIPQLPSWMSAAVLYAGIAGSVIAILAIQYKYNGSVFSR